METSLLQLGPGGEIDAFEDDEKTSALPEDVLKVIRKQFKQASHGSDFLNQFTLSQFMKKGYPTSSIRRLQKGSAHIIEKFGLDSRTISLQGLLNMYEESWEIDAQTVRDEMLRRKAKSKVVKKKRNPQHSRRKVSIGQLNIDPPKRKNTRTLSLSIRRSESPLSRPESPLNPSFSHSFLALNHSNQKIAPHS